MIITTFIKRRSQQIRMYYHHKHIVRKFYDKELYNRLKDMQDTEMSDSDEPYDSIGGFSVNDLRKSFKKTR